jgi:uncharacterized protein YciI
MRAIRILIAIAAAVSAQASLAAQDKKIDEVRMITYQAIFLTQGPNWIEPDAAGAEPITGEHRKYIQRLAATGRVQLAGPFSPVKGSTLRGVLIVKGSLEQAAAIAEADPGVQSGRWGVEILKWMGPDGWFQRQSGTETEKIFFGFLVNGPNRSQDAETAKQLQRAHLDYMDGQAKLGKLVLAGPLVDAGTRRGLIAYRVATMEEAQERASGDPMVRAGRLAVELYGWTIPRGVLK